MALKRYTYTYRDISGTLKEETIYGVSRAEVFAELKKARITPISLTTATDVVPTRKPSREILLGCTIVFIAALGCCIWWFVYRSTPLSPVSKQNAVPRKAPPSTNRVPRARYMTEEFQNYTVAPESKVASTKRWPRAEFRGKKVINYTVSTNDNGVIVERYTTADGNTHAVMKDPPPVFANASDQILAMTLSVPSGSELPPSPIPPTLKKDFIASLATPIIINDDDSDSVKALKETVINARRDMQELLKKGFSPAEVLQEHRRLQNENTAMRNQVVKELRTIIDSGDLTGAEEYVRKMNVALGEMGIMGISMPRSHDARRRPATQPTNEKTDVENQL